MDNVLLGEIMSLMSFSVETFTQVNSQQMWMNLNTTFSSRCVDCMIRMNFNLTTVDKGMEVIIM